MGYGLCETTYGYGKTKYDRRQAVQTSVHQLGVVYAGGVLCDAKFLGVEWAIAEYKFCFHFESVCAHSNLLVQSRHYCQMVSEETAQKKD